MNNYIKNIVESFNFNNINDVPSSAENISNILKYDILDLIDMGLPSGTLWCKYNAGVDHNYVKSKKIDVGPGYYKHWQGELCSWGETFPSVHSLVNFEKGGVKNQFDWHNYKYTQSDDYETEDSKLSHRLTKYCSKRFYGKDFTKDNLRILETIDDEAAFDALQWKYPYKVKLPTSKDYLELLKYTNKELLSDRFIDGLLLTSKINGAELFFPFTGLMNGPFHQDDYCSGHYWCADLYTDEPILAYSFNFGSFLKIVDKSLTDKNIMDEKIEASEFKQDLGTILTYERYKGLAIRGILA